MYLMKGLRLALAAQAGAALLFAEMVSAQTAQAADCEQVRIERLAGLGRLWGAVKFFHPSLAYKDIDWDGALIAAIPKVRAAETAEDYRQAVNGMLSVLKDPASIAVLKTHSQAASPAPGTEAAQLSDPSAYFRVAGETIIIPGRLAMTLGASEEALAERIAESLKEASSKVKGVVFDLRIAGTAAPRAEQSHGFGTFLRHVLPDLVAAPVTLGARQHREYSGYAPQPFAFAGYNGGYYSNLARETPSSLRGRRSASASPLSIAFIVNANTPDFEGETSSLLSGLQASRLAVIIEEVEPGSGIANLGNFTVSLTLAGEIEVHVRIGELVSPDGRSGFEPDMRVPAAAGQDMALEAAIKSLSTTLAPAANGQPTALHPDADSSYPDTAFPNAEYRLLALFRFWSVINYFFPYKHLMDGQWDAVLTEFIPIFESSRTAQDYQLSVMRMAARLQDSHVSVRDAGAAGDYAGAFVPPLGLAYVQGKFVVTVLDEPATAAAAGIAAGDEILAADGDSVQVRRSKLEPLIAASTPQSLNLQLARQLLGGARGSIARLRIRDASGAERDVGVERKLPWPMGARQPVFRFSHKVHEILPSGFAYIDMARLNREEVDAAMAEAAGAPAIVFDIRGYPKGTGLYIARRLVKQKAGNKRVIGALFSQPAPRGDWSLDPDALPRKVTFAQPLPTPQGPAYEGKVAILINEWAISQSEHTCLWFAAATDATFIGSPTAGANGYVTALVLPGGLTVSFSGQEVRFADGRQLQRLGIQPTIPVEPTVAGIRENRDEVLEAAVSFLQRQLKP
jgi:C-terminal processing protease CtpA/Prc